MSNGSFKDDANTITSTLAIPVATTAAKEVCKYGVVTAVSNATATATSLAGTATTAAASGGVASTVGTVALACFNAAPLLTIGGVLLAASAIYRVGKFLLE